jgi:sulfite reductase alpha subunit-like flavoprotein
VIHSSQTGHAEQLAMQTAQALQSAGTPAQVIALEMLDAAALADARRACSLRARRAKAIRRMARCASSAM